jgi:hypothetical protein
VQGNLQVKEVNKPIMVNASLSRSFVVYFALNTADVEITLLYVNDGGLSWLFF